MNTITGFKGFDKDLKCRDYQFEVGKEFIHEGEVKACESGFHFCEYPLDILGYYPPESRFCEVEGSGEISKHDDDSKVATSRLRIRGEIGLNGLIQASVKFIFDKVKWEDKNSNTGYYSAATNTGDNSAATNTGDNSAATNTGDNSAATNTGYNSAATNTGDRSAATNTGDNSAATNTGNYSAATNTGYYSAATNTGYYSAATNTGYKSAATNTGNYSAATNTGNYSAATNTGDYAAATVSGKDSIAVVTGYKGKAKGKIGCWLVLTERDENYEILSVKSVKVDGKKVKEDTFYMLVDNKIKEVE